MKLASVFGVRCIGLRWCPHEWLCGIVTLRLLVALTRAAHYRAAVPVQQACNVQLEWLRAASSLA